MNERAFIESRWQDWTRLEGLVEALEKGRLRTHKEIQEILRLYRRAASDLAEAQTHFAGSEVLDKLQLLVGRSYGAIYQKPEKQLGAAVYVTRTLPQTFRSNFGYFIFALTVFAFGLIVGAVVVQADERWAELCLPTAAIESIQRGELWTNLLSVVPSSIISAFVLYNNAVVCFTVFALGLSLGIGTICVLFLNGMVIGTTMSLSWNHGILGQLGSFVVGHGVLEISAVLLCGAGGLMMGEALVRPGRYRRLDALRIRAREALALAVGAVPFLAAAGFIEGYISPGDLHQPLKYALGVGTGTMLYLYLFTSGRRAEPQPGDAEAPVT